jgi:hypothetical protein
MNIGKQYRNCQNKYDWFILYHFWLKTNKETQIAFKLQ